MVECELGMNDCLAKMESWNLALGGINCDLSSTAPPTGVTATIAVGLVRLAAKLVQLAKLLDTDTGTLLLNQR